MLAHRRGKINALLALTPFLLTEGSLPPSSSFSAWALSLQEKDMLGDSTEQTKGQVQGTSPAAATSDLRSPTPVT